jgi:hypothetical protein
MSQLPFSFGYSFFARVIIPGQLAAAGLFLLIGPFVVELWPSLDAADKLAGITSVVLFAGVLTWLCNTRIYWLYEGVCWPRALRERATRRLQARVSRAKKRLDALKHTPGLERDLNWRWLHRFPIGTDGARTATLATELGNILEAAVTYPLRVYGMSPQFYWPRIWLSMDTEVRTTIDGIFSNLDLTVQSSAILLLVAALYVLAAAVQLGWTSATSEPIAYLQAPQILVVSGAVAAFLSRYLYSMSLDLACEVADYHAALFDLYRHKIKHMTEGVEESEKELWHTTWLRLRHQKVE